MCLLSGFVSDKLKRIKLRRTQIDSWYRTRATMVRPGVAHESKQSQKRPFFHSGVVSPLSARAATAFGSPDETSATAPASASHPQHGAQEEEEQLPQQKHRHKSHVDERKKSKKEDLAVGINAWITMPSTERDIFVDRCRKEIAPLLGAIPPAGTLRGEEEAHTDDIGRRGRCAPMHGITGGDRTRKKAKLRVQKVFSYRDGTAQHKFARQCICIGINEVTRALERDELSLILICRDVRPARLVEHVAVLAAVRDVPFFLLPKATSALGQALGLKCIAALGFRGGELMRRLKKGENDTDGSDNDAERVVMDDVRSRLQSFLDFLLTKQDYMNAVRID